MVDMRTVRCLRGSVVVSQVALTRSIKLTKVKEGAQPICGEIIVDSINIAARQKVMSNMVPRFTKLPCAAAQPGGTY